MLVVSAINNTATVMQMYKLTATHSAERGENNTLRKLAIPL